MPQLIQNQQKYGKVPENRIYFLGADDNWWSPGDNGPCGPCSEMFYDMKGGVGDLSKENFLKAVKEESVIELWNDVFMEYEKKDGKVVGKLKQKNVDTGAGLERITAVMQGKQTAYDTDLFETIMGKISELTDSSDERAKRIVADHIRTAVFMISDGVIPSNTEKGYILRRILRRAVRYSDILNLKHGSLFWIAGSVIEKYKLYYGSLSDNSEFIKKEIDKEENKFRETLKHGLKEFERGEDPFILFTTHGFPIELTIELAKEKNKIIDLEDFNKKMAEHQKLSQTASAGMFKGGLANHNEKTIKLHTTHHLLLAALQAVVDKNIKQRGSNITEERLRMDFLCDHKLTDEEKKKVEDWVNEKIKNEFSVIRKEMPRAEALNIGAEMEFGTKYPDIVSVYFIEDKDGNVISKEFCGGPHISSSKELGQFKIQKEEAVAQGIRRIKALLT
jgi:alanyl-tRNA synthetase